MKLKLSLLSLVMLCVASFSLHAADVTLKASTLGMANEEELPFVTDVYQLTIDAANNTVLQVQTTGNSPKYYENGYSIRIYKGSTMTIKSDKVMAKIELTITNNKKFQEDAVQEPNATSFVWHTPDGDQSRISDIEITYAGSTPPTPVTYTVTLKDDNTALAQTTTGEALTLPTRTACAGFDFAGWSETNITAWTTTKPTIIPAGSYTPTANIDLYPVYTKTETSGGSGTPTIASVTFSASGYANNEEVASANVDANVTLTFDKGTNSNAPKYYNTGTSIRVYGGGTMTVAVNGSKATSIKLTFGTGDGANDITVNEGTYADGTWTGESDNIVFTVDGTSGQRRIASVEVVYGGSVASTTISYISTNPCGSTPPVTPTKYTITLSVNDDAMGTVTGAGEYEENTKINITATEKAGYQFVKWSDENTQQSREITVTANMTYTAIFEAIPAPTLYTVNLKDDNTALTQTTSGEALTLPARTACTGFDFAGWSETNMTAWTTTKPTIIPAGSYTPTANLDLYPVYTKTETSGGSGTPTTVVDKLNNAAIGTTGTSYKEVTDISVTSIAKYYAQSAGGNDAIQLRSGSNNSGIVSTTSAGKVTKVSVVWNTETNAARVLSVYGKNTAYTDATELYDTDKQGDLLGEIAKASDIELGITGDYQYIGVRSKSGALYLDELNISWLTGAATSTTSYISANPCGSTPPVTPTKYTITLSVNDDAMGTVTGAGEYEENETVQIAAIAKAGYQFVKWSDENTEPTRTITVTESLTFTAIFEVQTPVEYTVTLSVNDSEMGEVTGTGKYFSGDYITITATPKTGYRFVEWSDKNTNPTRQLFITRNFDLTAIFEVDKPLPITYTLKLEINNPEMGEVKGTGTYAEGTEVEIEAVVKAGYKFVRWSDGNTEPKRTITITSDLTLTAYLDVITIVPVYHTVTLHTNDIQMGHVTGGGTYEKGETVTIEAIPESGHRFLNWSDGVTDAKRTFELTKDTNLLATFEKIVIYYTVTVVVNDPTMGTVTGAGQYEQGTEVIVEEKPADGYRFVNWGDGNANSQRRFIIENDTTIYATFEKIIIYHDLILRVNDTEMGHVTGTGNYEEGTVVEIEAIAEDGYRFLYWSDGNQEAKRQIIVDADITLIASFEKIVIYHTVSLAVNDQNMGSVTGAGTFEEYSDIIIEAKANEGYRFLTWSDGNVNARRTIRVDGDIDLTAIFEKIIINYLVTLSVNDATMGTVAGAGNYEAGTLVTIEAQPLSGYRFLYWSDGNQSQKREFNIQSDITLMAFFEQVPEYFTVTLAVNDETMGTVIGGGTYNANTAIEIGAIAYNGYEFVSWSDGNTNPKRSLTVTEDITLTATFQKIFVEPTYYTLTTNALPETAGTVTGAGEYAEGTTVILEATANDHYQFYAWSDGVRENPRTVVLTADMTITAMFQPERYTLTLLCDNTKGKVSGAGTYTYNAEIEISAGANKGYEFVSWSDGSTDNPRIIVMQEDLTLEAFFTESTSDAVETINASDSAVRKVVENGQIIILMPDGRKYSVLGTEIEE